jgi:hypothetical protein
MTVFIALSVLLLAQSVWSLVDGYRYLRLLRRSFARAPSEYLPSAAVIIPVKGWEPDFAHNAWAFLSQDYPQYRVVFSLGSSDDPAWPALNRVVHERAGREACKAPAADIVVGPRSPLRGDKVQNLLNAVEALVQKPEVVVFADIDAHPKPDWLRSLVAPLADPAVTVSTGFRWYLPGPNWGTRLRAAWDASIATMLGDHDRNFAWGGSMTMRWSEFERLQIASRYWQRTVSDDYAVRQAIRDQGGHIRFEPRCLLKSGGSSSFYAFLKWSNRQVILTRVYAPDLWVAGLASHSLYLTGMGLAVALLCSRHTVGAKLLVLTVLAGILVLGAAKGRLRGIVTRELFPEESALLNRYGSCYWRFTPLVPWVMLYNFVVAGLTRRIDWAGNIYEIWRDHIRIAGQRSGQ